MKQQHDADEIPFIIDGISSFNNILFFILYLLLGYDMKFNK